MNIKEYCESNKDYALLLNDFTRRYMGAYNKLRVAQRKEIKIYLHRNFGYWFYSNLDPYGEISPCNFINSNIAHVFKQAAVVFPVCEPVYKKEKLENIRYRFQVYSIDNHPFVKDMATLIDVFKDYSFPSGGFKSLTEQDYFDILNNKNSGFALREFSYLSMLHDICLDIGLLQWEDGENCDKPRINEQNRSEFFALTAGEQLRKIVSVIIERFVDILKLEKLSKKIPTAKQLHSMLKNGMEIETFLKKAFSFTTNDITLFEDFAEDNFTEYNLDKLDDPEIFNKLFPQVESIMNIAGLCAIIHRYFFLPIGQYLQLFQPMYNFMYMNSQDSRDNKYLEMIKSSQDEQDKKIMAFIAYMTPPERYKLSPLGVALFRNGEPERKPLFGDVPYGEYQATLEDMLNEDEDIRTFFEDM